MSNDHQWVTVTVDGGPMGESDFQRCRACGANGGLRALLVPGASPDIGCFIACGCGLHATELDGLTCEAAQQRIAEHLKTCPHAAEWLATRKEYLQ